MFIIIQYLFNTNRKKIVYIKDNVPLLGQIFKELVVFTDKKYIHVRLREENDLITLHHPQRGFNLRLHSKRPMTNRFC